MGLQQHSGSSSRTSSYLVLLYMVVSSREHQRQHKGQSGQKTNTTAAVKYETLHQYLNPPPAGVAVGAAAGAAPNENPPAAGAGAAGAGAPKRLIASPSAGNSSEMIDDVMSRGAANWSVPHGYGWGSVEFYINMPNRYLGFLVETHREH